MARHDLVDYLVMAHAKGASDLHVSPNATPMIRVSGSLEPLTENVLDSQEAQKLIYAILRETQRARLEHDLELDFAVTVEGAGRFRANASYTLGSASANFRFIPDSIPTLSELGHSPTVEKWCDERAGLILVTGTSGSGKSHTLASMTQKIADTHNKNIVSIEDPVEFLFKQGRSLVHQREVGADTRGFAEAMRSALRQDANVIIVGEMRDEETIRTAVTAAETGHLVIGTLHTTDATTAVSRVLDAYPEEQQRFVSTQLSSAMLGVVCQHLLPIKDSAGLVLASEILVVNTGIASCIRNRRLPQIPGLIQIGAADGMHTVDDSLLNLLLTGRITLGDALQHATDENQLLEHFKLAQKEQRKSWFGRVMGGGKK